jgi:tellurite resistance protein TehA-like permease
VYLSLFFLTQTSSTNTQVVLPNILYGYHGLAPNVRYFNVRFNVNLIVGTGGISLLLDAFPYGPGLPMKVFSLVLFFFNLLLFVVFSAWAITRYYWYPEDWIELMNHPTLSLFLGCFPMSFTTILNVAIDVIYGYFSFGGKGFLYSIWILWWINVAVSSAYGWGMMHHMYAAVSLFQVVSGLDGNYCDTGSRVKPTPLNK